MSKPGRIMFSNSGIRLLTASGALATAFVSGCHAPYPEGPDPEQVRIRTEILNLSQNAESMQGRLDMVLEEQESLRRELELLRDSMRESADIQASHRAGVDRRIQALDQARAADRQAMVDEVSRRIAGHLEQTAAQRAPTPSAPRTERGRYHEVRSGETLSEIAAAYGARVNVIVQANEIPDPNRLRIGQRLFIPD